MTNRGKKISVVITSTSIPEYENVLTSTIGVNTFLTQPKMINVAQY